MHLISANRSVHACYASRTVYLTQYPPGVDMTGAPTKQ